MNEIICRECHSPNKSGSKFCSNCGASLKAATHIICPNCYHRNPLHLLYCDNCGTRLIKQATAPLTSLPPEPELEPLIPPARAFSLPTRNPGETGELDPDSLPDWLKTGVDKKAAVPAEDEERLSDWLNELKATGGVNDVDELGSLNLDWLNEPVAAVEPPPPPPQSIPVVPPTAEASDEPAEDEALDWLSAMDDLSLEEEAAVPDAPTGFTGWLNPDTLPETAAPSPSPAEPEEDAADWLTEIDNETFISEDSGRTGFTGWLESKKLDPRDVDFEDELEEDESFAVGMSTSSASAPRRERENEDLPDWLLNAPNAGTAATPSPTPPTSEESTSPSGFTGWLREQDLLDEPIQLGDSSPSGGSGLSSEATGFTGWLSEQGLAAEESSPPPATASPTFAKNEDADDLDWLSLEEDTAEGEDDPDALRQEMVGTGFTGWLNPSVLEQVEVDDQSQTTADWPPPSSSRGLPDWLDTGELTSPEQEEEEEEVGTGFTGWLNPAHLEAIAPPIPSPTPTAEPEIPDWLLAGPDDDEESGGTGFTDWLAGGKAEAAEGDEEDNSFGWLEEEEEEVMPQELMTPLSKEEAHKLLENTPDVSEEFIQEVVEGDFPDWLTDVKNNEDAVSTDVLPAWISAPLSTTDELELGFRPASSSPKPAAEEVEDDWLSGLGTAAGSPSLAMGDDSWLTDLGAADPTSLPSDEDSAWLSDLGLGLETEAEDDDALFIPSTAAADAAWLGDLPSADMASAATDDDWLAGLELEMGLADGNDLLNDLPNEGGEQEWDLSGFGTSSLPDLDWMASQEAAEGPIEPLDFLAEEPAPAIPAEPDEFAYLLGEESSPVATAEDADESNFDWLGALGDETIEPSTAPAVRDRQAWLQGADLADDTETAASEGSRELDEALQTTVFTSRPKQPKPESSTTDIAQMVSNLREEADEVADEEILSELEALRQPDGLEGDFDDYEEELLETTASITGDDLRLDMGVADPSLQQKQMSGPLAGLMGVVPVASAMSGLMAVPSAVSTAATQPEQVALMRHITRQNGHAITTNALDELLGTPADTPAAKRRVDWAQMLLGLLLLAAVIGGFLLPNLIPTNPPMAAPGLIHLENQLATLRGQTILVVFDYTPALAGELDPSAELLLAQLAQNGNEFVTMSQYPTGMATAASLLEGLPVIGSLGYVPGEALGLRQLAGCLNGQPCGVANVPPIAAVLVLAGDRDSLQDWMEQVAPQVAQPILAAVPQAVAPTAQPYLTSGQLDGLLGGLSSTAVLAANTQASPAAEELRQSQTLAQLLALAILILSPLAALAQRRKK